MAAGCFGNFKHLVLDEISLEGLEGVSIDSLWIILSARLKCTLPLNEKIKQAVWRCIEQLEEQIEFYELPNDSEDKKTNDRFKELDEILGVPIVQERTTGNQLKFVPSDYAEWGSCENYCERKLIPFEEIRKNGLQQTIQRWGKKLVIVAKQKQRVHALLPPNVLPPTEINAHHFCYWESIGRARFNGETTSGANSLAQYCKDGTIMFYIKNKLVNLGVVAIRQYTEIHQQHVNITNLLTLSRFYTPDCSKLTKLVYKIYNLLKERPGHLIRARKIREYFPFLERNRDFKRITMSYVFRSVFEVRHPTDDEMLIMQSVSSDDTDKTNEQDNDDVLDTDECDKKTKSKKKTKQDDGVVQRIRPIIILRNPNKNLEELLQDKDETRLINTGSDYEDDEQYEIVSDDSDYEKHTFVDMPLREEIYRAIWRHGRYGCSQTQLQVYLNMHYLTVRQILRGLLASKVICRYCTDSGRQKIYMYVALEYGHDLENISTFENLDFLKCDENPKEHELLELIQTDIPEIAVKIEHVKPSENTTFRHIETLRDKMRKHTIIMALNQKLILALPDAVAEVQKTEKEYGYKDEICRKSLKRLIFKLQQEEIINYYSITITFKGVDRIQTYITHPKLNETNMIVQQEIFRLKHAYYNQYEERRLREEVSVQCEKQRSLRKSGKKIVNKKSDQHTKQSHSIRQLCLRGAASQKPPKFLISRSFHEFLYYLVVELSDCQIAQKITRNTLEYWQHSAPDLNVNQFMDEMSTNKLDESVLLYNDFDLNWRTFIPPLPHYSDKPCGWIYIPDAIDRLPFALFNKIFRLNKDANPQLIDFLNHPVRQYYLVRHLPLELQYCISRHYQQQIYCMILKLLNNMGLLQVHQLKGQSRDSMNMWVYFNRKVCIKDTTTSKECYQEIENDRTYELLYITLQSTSDLNKYWTCLHRTCVYTKLGFRRNKFQPASNKRIQKRKEKEIDFLDTVQFDVAPIYDNADIPGNGLGAAGLDSYMFAHVFRNWSWVANVTSPLGHPRQRIRHAWPSNMRKNSKSTYKIHMAKVNKIKKMSVKKFNLSKKTEPRDPIDVDAMKNMRTLRVKWSKEEDQIINVTRTVYLFLEPPINTLGLLDVARISRDLIRQCLGICNKTVQTCVRRAQFLVKKNLHVPFVPTWLNMLQTNIGIQKSFKIFLEKLEEVHKKNVKTIVELNFLNITLFLLERIVEGQQLNMSINRQHKFLILSDVSEFYKKFKIRSDKERSKNVKKDSMVTYVNPMNIAELEITKIICVLHSLLCCTKDKTLYHMQAFDIFKHFSEETLKKAFAKARANTLVIPIKRRNLSMQPAQLAAPSYVLSNKYRLRLLFLKMPYGIFDCLYIFQQKFIKNLNAMQNKKNSKTTMPAIQQGANNKKRKLNKNDVNGGDINMSVRSVTSGQFFFIAEGLSKQYWRLGISLQANILTVDVEPSQNLSSYDRILSHHQSIFNHAPETHYDKIVETDMIEEIQSRVKFNRSHVSYKIHYSPWDYISKLPIYQMHYFCALDAMDKEVEINLSQNKPYKSQKNNGENNETCSLVCPFNLCIMEKQDYLAEIQRILEERRSMIETIVDDNKLIENIKLSTEQATTVLINQNNIVALIRSLHAIWQKQLHLIERKDVGSVKKLTTTDSAEKKEETTDKGRFWLGLCKEILNYNSKFSDDLDKINDYELMVSKEDRNFTRAQDVFVIKLPTLKICPTNKTLKLLCKTEENESCEISPDSLLETEKTREKVLMKILNESIWKYTDNTFDGLKHKWESMKLNTMEQQHLKEIHDCIEKRPLGIQIDELRILFPYESFLIRSLDVLSENWIIKRVGVASRMYVHKTHIKPWLVQTFHIKHYEGGEFSHQTKATSSQKRLHESLIDGNDSELANSANKRIKVTEDLNQPIKTTTENSETISDSPQYRSSSNKDINQSKRDFVVLRPQPWVRLNGSLNRRVIDRWLGSMLIECIHRNGMSVVDLCKRFPHMMPVDIMFLLEILNDLKCVNLKELSGPKNNISLISDYQPFSEINVTSMYDLNKTFIYVTNDSITRMTNFIGKKKYNSEYI